MSDPHSENRTSYSGRRPDAICPISSLPEDASQKRLEEHDWYHNMIIDCRAAMQTGIFEARWRLIYMYHGIGTRILEENDNLERAGIYGEKIVQRVAESLHMGQRTLRYAIQFAREYPKQSDLDELPGGMNLSWHKVTNKILQGKSLDEYCTHKETETVTICKDCHIRIKE